MILTPHVSGITPFYFPRMAQIVADNLRRFSTASPCKTCTTRTEVIDHETREITRKKNKIDIAVNYALFKLA